MQPCAPFRRSQQLKSISLHSRVQTSPLLLPEGTHTGKFPLRQKGRRKSPLEIAPLSSRRRPGGVSHVSLQWGLWRLTQVQGLNIPRLCSDRETAIFLYSPYPPLTTLLGSAWIHRNFAPLSPQRLPCLWQKCLLWALTCLSEHAKDAQTQPCWPTPSETPTSHLIPTEHPSQPRHFNYYALAFDFLTRIYCSTEIAWFSLIL